MSKIEVNAIEPQCGTTLTAGGGAGKTVVVDVNPREQTIADSVKRVFGTDGKKITFQMM